MIGVNLRGAFLCAGEAEREFLRRDMCSEISAAAGHVNYAARRGGSSPCPEASCCSPRGAREMYKRRNEVERLFRRLKGYRRIFSRFEKLDVMFLGFISFALIADGLRLCTQQSEI
ncbi:hypothetical protein QTI66_37535 [Variovorax sp. J22R133]|uniref:hypothetical protein n=1 Tax=Variovorax brevis TaxID=3053503 RepID=UPI002577A2FE|nr:hypothetical protein [Variovorax sp. J22R133]MDM0117801.1 hypothetical protein [Variovorax sp. J22R133]